MLVPLLFYLARAPGNYGGASVTVLSVAFLYLASLFSSIAGQRVRLNQRTSNCVCGAHESPTVKAFVPLAATLQPHSMQQSMFIRLYYIITSHAAFHRYRFFCCDHCFIHNLDINVVGCLCFMRFGCSYRDCGFMKCKHLNKHRTHDT